VLSKQKVNYNYHSFMADYAKFCANPFLNYFFNVVSTSPCCDDSFSFVSTIEGKKYPFYAFQHHPEWGVQNFYTTAKNTVQKKDTRDVARTIMEFFMTEAGKNEARFVDPGCLSQSLRFIPLLSRNFAAKLPRGRKSYKYDPTKYGLDPNVGMTALKG
jgi:hypothetical protein